MHSKETGSARILIYAAAILLAFFHQDFWLWGNRSLLFGFLPVGLGYHMIFSLLSGCVWALAVVYAWPSRVEEFAEMEPASPSGAERSAGNEEKESATP